MRFEVDFQLNSQEIPKDKNKLFASWMKFFMKKYDDVMFDKLYNSGAVTKNYTYSVFLGTDVVFKQESIKLSSDRIKLFFTCYDMRESLAFYNIFTRARNEEYNYKNLIIKATSINVEKNIIFKSNQECFKTMSPIIIREHFIDENVSDFFHCVGEEKGKAIFVRNIKSRLKKQFGESVEYDLEKFDIEVVRYKMVTVRHHELNIPSNLAILKISAKPYVMEYLYYAGTISSFNASGYGMLKHIKNV